MHHSLRSFFLHYSSAYMMKYTVWLKSILTLWHIRSFSNNRFKPSLPHCSGHHQCGCGCNGSVWPLRWGLWGDARRRLSSYWNQQDAHFPVHRGRRLILNQAHTVHPASQWKSLLLQLSSFSLGSVDQLWHSSAVWLSLYPQRERRGQH